MSPDSYPGTLDLSYLTPSYASFWLKAVVSQDSLFQAKASADKNETMTIYRKGSVYKQITGTRKLEKSTKAFPKLIDINCITPFFSYITKYKRQHFHSNYKNESQSLKG